MFRLFVNSGFTLSFPPPFNFNYAFFDIERGRGDSVLIRAASSLMEGELSIAAQAQCRWVQAREAEIFGRLTTSVVCRGIWGRELGGHVIIGGYIFAKDRTGHTRDLTLSLGAFFVSPSALSFFSRNLPGPSPAVTGIIFCRFFRVIFQCPCHGRLVSLVHTSTPSLASFALIFFFYPSFVPKIVCFAATYTLPFPHYSIFLVTCKVWFGLLGV